MIIRFFVLSSLGVVIFGGGTYTGWRAARFLDPVLDAKDRSAIISQTIHQTVGSWFDE